VENATRIVREGLAGTGVQLVGSCGVDVYDARAPEGYRSSKLMPGARGLVVVGSAGPVLWRAFRAHMDERRERWNAVHPLDTFVASILARGDDALSQENIRFRRFEPTFHAALRLDFVAMAQLVGLGSPGPFGLLIHSEHGAWWALRGAWLVDAEVDAPLEHRAPCVGCPAPCIGGWQNAGTIVRATPDARARCVVGQSSRYDDDQVAYFYDRLATVARLSGQK